MDSHTIYWDLADRSVLSSVALAALAEAEISDGIVVSAWSIPELWLATTRKRGARAIPHASCLQLRDALADPENAVEVEPFGPAMWSHFEAAALLLADPFDCAVVATAKALGLALVTYDDAIRASGAVNTVW